MWNILTSQTRVLYTIVYTGLLIQFCKNMLIFAPEKILNLLLAVYGKEAL